MEQAGSQGLILNYDDAWELEQSIKRVHPAVFLRSLLILFDESSVLVLGDTMAKDIIDFISGREPEEKTELEFMAGNDGWCLELCLLPPFLKRCNRPGPLYMTMRRADLLQLAELTYHHAQPEVCTDLAVYQDDLVLMEYHDVCSGGVPFISGTIAEDKVKAFCEAVGFRYQRYAVD